MIAAFLQRIPVEKLGRIDEGNPQIGREEKFSAAEVRRRNAYDREGVLIDLYGAAHSGAVTVEVTVPEGVAQNDLRHAVLSMFFGSMDEPAKIGLNAERIEVIAAHHVGPDHGWVSAAGIEPDAARDVIRNQRIEAVVPVAQVEVIRIRLRRRGF